MLSTAMLAALLLLAACSARVDRSTGSTSPATTRRPLPIDFSKPGPYKVGTLSIEIPSPVERVDIDESTGASSAARTTTRTAAVFYPADAGADGQYRRIDAYTTADVLPDQVRANLPPELVQTVAVDLLEQPPANREGPFPLVLHSHDTGGSFRFESRHFEHLASWGIVVAAPDHQERSLTAQLLPGTTGSPDPSADQDVIDLRNTLAALRAQNLSPTGRLQGVLNLDEVATEGHGSGARTAALLAKEQPIKAFIGLAPTPMLETADLAAVSDLQPAQVQEKLRSLTPPSKPSMLVVGDGDDVVAVATVRSEFEWLGSGAGAPDGPSRTLVVLRNAGHQSFTDLCAPIRARGGLSQYIPKYPLLAGMFTKGENGCTPEDLDPDRAYALVNQLTVAQLRWVFRLDDDRVSLDPSFLSRTFGEALGSIESEGHIT